MFGLRFPSVSGMRAANELVGTNMLLQILTHSGEIQEESSGYLLVGSNTDYAVIDHTKERISYMC